MPHLEAVHIDKALTNVSVMYHNAAYIGEVMFPVVPVAKESDKYFVYGKENFAQHGTLRADGSEANDFKWSVSNTSYTAEEYALRTTVTDRERANADAPISPDIDATEILTDTIKLDWEIRCQTLAATSGSVGNTATPSTQWDTVSTADVYGDILTGQETIRAAIAKYPTHIFIPARVAMYMAQNATIVDMVKHTHSDLLTMPGQGGWLLPSMLWGMRVVIMMAIKNTANLQQSESLSDVWGDTVFIAYIEPSPGLKKISWGYTLQARGWQTKKWREEAREADMVEVSTIRALELVATSCAYSITDTLAAI